MSQANSFQPWKQTLPVGLPSNLASAIFGGGAAAVGNGKVPATLSPLQPVPSPSSSSSSSSSSSCTVSSSVSSSTLPLTAPPPGTGPLLLSTMLSIPSVSTGAVSSSSVRNHPTSSPAAILNAAGEGGDFLAQMAINKLKMGKLSASYELATTNGAPASHQPSGMADPSDPNLQELDVEHDPDIAAMRAMLAANPDPYSHHGTTLADKEREQQIQQIFEKSVSDNTKKQIVEILEKISTLRPPERLLLYLRMPGGYPETDPLRQSQNPLGTRLEINHTINWVRSHLEHDPNVSIPKQEVYDDYVSYCARINIKPLSTADFGKVMKQVFPGIRPRRLGTRGHSRYCYAAMRKATKLPTPKLPDLTNAAGSSEKLCGGEEQNFSEEESWKVVKVWAEAMLPACFGTINELAGFIAKNNLNTPTGIASRQQLHKKILQREMKEKRKLSAVTMKKRRKKRRKTLSTSIGDATEPMRTTSTPDGEDRDGQPKGGGTFDALVEAQQRNVSTNLAPGAGQRQQTVGGIGSPPPSSATNAGVHNQLLLQHHMIKREHQDYLDEDNNNTPTTAVNSGGGGGKMMILQRQQQPQHQKQQQPPSTNLTCDNSNGVLESMKKDLMIAVANGALQPPSSPGGQSVISHGNHHPSQMQQPQRQHLQHQQQQQQHQQMMQQRLLDGGMRSPQELLSNVYCKKVRQAQQLKAVQQQQQQQLEQRPHPNHAQLQPPLLFPNRPTSAQKRQLAQSMAFAGRQKRLRLLQQRQQQSLESQNNSAPRYDEQGNLVLIESQDPNRDEFIIPRERVISICNMDKNALDGYLNCEEENSQEQDQELLKYFPEEDGGQQSAALHQLLQQQQMDSADGRESTSMDNEGSSYGAGYGTTGMFDDNEKLYQIRMILEKNQTTQNQKQLQMFQMQQMQQSMATQMPGGNGGSYDASATQQSSVSLTPGSAAASLAMLSQRHNTHVGTPEPTGDSGIASSTIMGGIDQQQKSKFVAGNDGGGSGSQGYGIGQTNGLVSGGNLSSLTHTLQSPTARRKNYNFVPISDGSSRMGSGGKQQQQQQPPQQQQQAASPFVSPRSTPIHRKANKPSNGLTLNLLEHKFNNQHQQQHGPSQQHLHPQVAGSYHQQQQQTRTSMSYIKNELSASAPPSPSLMQPYRFGAGLNCGMSSMSGSFQPICAPHANHPSPLSGAGGEPNGGLVSSLESRSSSVPLIPNYDGYCNSNYTSVSQTPVPSEYDDFTDTGNILDMLNDQSSQLTSSIKIEESELTLPDLLDRHQQHHQQQQEGGFFSRAANYNIISRSVPSTPLPHHMGGGFGGNVPPAVSGSCIGVNTIGSGGLGIASKSMFELPKSVPSTPIALNDGCHEPMFQYSPETSRDFLINGNSVDRSKSSVSSFFSSIVGSSGVGVGSGSCTTTTSAIASSTVPSMGIETNTDGSMVGVEHHHHPSAGVELHSTGGGIVVDPVAPPTAEIANLTDGIEGLSNDLDGVTDSMIDSDILQNL